MQQSPRQFCGLPVDGVEHPSVARDEVADVFLTGNIV